MPMVPDDRTRRFYMLDLFRFLAATAVMIGHTGGGKQILGFYHSYLAVDFFFVLSGFILAWHYFDNPFNYRNFAIDRIARIWPLNIATLLLAAAVPDTLALAPNHARPVVDFILNFFLLQGTGLGAEASYDSPSWTVSAEFWINLLFPLLFLRRWIFALPLAALAYAWLVGTWGHLDLWGPQAPNYGPSGAAMLRCFAGFSFGVATYYAFKASLRFEKLPLTVLEIASILAFAAMIFFCPPQKPTDLAAIPVFMLLVFAFAHQKGFLSCLVRPISDMAVFLGATSYGIYLWHTPIANLLGFDVRAVDLPGDAFFIGVTLLTAIASLYFIEKPAKKHLRKALKAGA